MAEKEFLIAARARDLMGYTYKATKPRRCEGETGRAGFSKSAYWLYGADMRQCAKQVVMNVHGANACDPKGEHGERMALIREMQKQCSLMLEFIQLCLDEKLISIAQAEMWTEKVLDVKKAAAGWRRAEKQRVAGPRPL